MFLPRKFVYKGSIKIFLGCKLCQLVKSQWRFSDLSIIIISAVTQLIAWGDFISASCHESFGSKQFLLTQLLSPLWCTYQMDFQEIWYLGVLLKVGNTFQFGKNCTAVMYSSCLCFFLHVEVTVWGICRSHCNCGYVGLSCLPCLPSEFQPAAPSCDKILCDYIIIQPVRCQTPYSCKGEFPR